MTVQFLKPRASIEVSKLLFIAFCVMFAATVAPMSAIGVGADGSGTGGAACGPDGEDGGDCGCGDGGSSGSGGNGEGSSPVVGTGEDAPVTSPVPVNPNAGTCDLLLRKESNNAGAGTGGGIEEGERIRPRVCWGTATFAGCNIYPIADVDISYLGDGGQTYQQNLGSRGWPYIGPWLSTTGMSAGNSYTVTARLTQSNGSFKTCTYNVPVKPGSTPPSTTKQCNDGTDNDSDGLVDASDPGCWTTSGDPTSYNPNDDDETNPVTPPPSTPQCSDGVDNDSDGRTDASDPGCWTTPGDPTTYNPNDDDETDPPAPASTPITSVGVTVTPNPAMVGETVVWRAGVVGGEAPFNYVWTGTNALAGTGITKNKIYNTPGTKQGTVNVTDDVGQTGTGSTNLTVYDYPTGTITNNPDEVRVGSTTDIVWTTADTNNCLVTSSPDVGSFTGTSNSGTPTGAIPGDVTFTLSCQPLTGGPVVVVDTTTVTTLGLPVLDNPGSSDIVRAGTPFTLNWDTTDSDPATCSITGQGVSGYNSLPTKTGSLTVSAENDSTYTISCDAGISTYSIEVVPETQEI